MNEKTNDKLENNNSMEQQENIDEKLSQEKGKDNKILDEDVSEKNECSGDEDISENNEK